LNNPLDYGRKVFFLYPHNVIEEHILLSLIKNEFEVYLVRDHGKLLKLLHQFPRAMVYINIDETLTEADWSAYVKNIKELFPDDPIGIFSSYNNSKLAEKYLMDIGVQSGFITLRSGVENARVILNKTLLANEARGRRRYIRVRPSLGAATLNIRHQGNLVSGKIFDVSSVGLSCSFDAKDLDFPEGSKFKDIQLMLKGLRVKVDAVVVKKRAEPGKIPAFILLFDQTLLPTDREKIHTFILRSLQVDLEGWLAKL